MVQRASTYTTGGQERSILEKPVGFPGSLPEYIVYITLIRQGMRPDIDFIFQSRFGGGKIERGGMVIDFMFNNPPNLAINVQGTYYHYEQGSINIAQDLLAREILAGEGISLIFLDEDDIMIDPTFYVREALNFRDYSRFSLGR